MNRCVAFLGLLVTSIYWSHLYTGSSETTWTIIKTMGFAAGAACVGLWAIADLITLPAAGGIIGLVNYATGSTALGFSVAGGATSVALTAAFYQLFDLLTR